MAPTEEKSSSSQDNSSQDESSQENAALDERPPSIVYGPSTPVPLTMTFSELLNYHAEVRGDHPAVVSHPQGTSITFRKLRDRSIQLARAMSQDGIGNGDLVALSLGSRIEYFEVDCLCFVTRRSYEC